MLRFLCTGDWTPGGIQSRLVPGTRRQLPEVDAAINAAWSVAADRLGSRLFDGPMCRLEGWSVNGPDLQLQLSPTSYKPFLGTNMTNPQFGRLLGRDVLASPLGVSSILLSADGWLMLGRRNQSVAYYPGRIHPFAGCVEPTDPDVFGTARRELLEELALGDADLTDLRCVGLVEDHQLMQPELVFLATAARTRLQVEQQLDGEEHRGVYAVHATAADIEPILQARGQPSGATALTPVAVASLLLFGRHRFGQDWFDRLAQPLIGPTDDGAGTPSGDSVASAQ